MEKSIGRDVRMGNAHMYKSTAAYDQTLYGKGTDVKGEGLSTIS